MKRSTTLLGTVLLGSLSLGAAVTGPAAAAPKPTPNPSPNVTGSATATPTPTPSPNVTGSATATPTPTRSPHDDRLAAAVVQWFTNGGDTRITALQTDFEAIGKAANSTDIAGVKSGCATLAADVKKAQRYDPLPDAKAQTHWAAALRMYATGATDCMNGAEKVNTKLLRRANAEVTHGSAEMTKATTRVHDILD
jgi:hypothetical protein